MTFASIAADFQAHFWQYISMPLIAGFVGYVTKMLALEMMFRPLEFVGIKPPYLGWQGVVPRKAHKMAATATDLLIGRLFTVEELIQRIDPERMLAEMQAPLMKATEQLVREIGEKYVEGFWKRLPEFGRRAVIRRVQSELPGLAKELWKDLQRDPTHYIDVKHLLVANLVRDKALLNEIFKNIGAKEFAFFRNAGFWFGAGIGLVQLA